MSERPDTPQQRSAVAGLGIAMLLALLPLQLAAQLDFARLLQLAGQRYGAETVAQLDAWRDLLRDASAVSTRERLLRTNDFFNSRIRFAPDTEVYGADDYWATPLETLGNAAGDCEDFSIAKYVTLLNLGVAPDSLRLVYVNAQMPGGASQAHMVLAWYESPTATPLILDNINTALLRADQRRDLRPVFSFNADALWIAGRAGPSGASPRARLSRWQQVLNRISREGFTAAW